MRASDEAGVPKPSGTPAGLDRRSMIKGAAIAGAAAWSAPVIIDSLTSPAAAASATPGCYQMLFTANGSSCSNGPTVGSASCSITGTACASPATSIPSNVAACISVTSPSPCNTGNTNASTAITFSVGSGCNCTIVAAAGRRTSIVGAQCSVDEVIAPDGKSVVFDGTGTSPNFAEWDRFEIWLSCT